MENKTGKALGWKLLERFGVTGIQLVLQIILARLLSPEHYSALAVMIIFTSLANVFIQNGFNTSLVQKKDVTDEDYSSVFWVTLGIAGIMYAIIFFASPLIATIYKMPEIVAPFRVLALMLFPGAFNSIQLAKASKELNFKKVFISNIGAIIVAGGAGVAVALLGGGLWALVAQMLASTITSMLVMFFTVKFRPRLVCNIKRVGSLFSYGWKLLVSGFINTLYQDIRSLVIGVKYDKSTLGYYDKGKQFPQLATEAINTSVQAVMLPVMAKEQDEKSKVKEIMRNSISISSYIILPMMAGLAAVATPLVTALLTEKWLPCVPFLMIYCFTFAFYPIHSCNLQAINAMGRSDIFLKLEIIKKTIGISSLVIAVFCFDSPIAIAATGIITTVTSSFINAYPNKKLIGYSYFEQIKDILPSLLMSGAMFALVFLFGKINLGSSLLTLVLQVIIGLVIYLLLSLIIRPAPFKFLVSQAKNAIKNRGKSKENGLQTEQASDEETNNENNGEKSMKKILLLGGSAQQVIAIQTAKNLGYYTVLCDYLPDNPGQYEADKFYQVSTTDKDAILEVARNEKIDGILAYASDPAAPTSAYVAEKMGLAGSPYESVEILCNKDKFRRFLSENGFCTPKAKGYSELEDAISDIKNSEFKMPVIVKPTDSSGSKGVGRIDNIDEAEEKLEYAMSFSRGKKIIVEEYVEKFGYQIAGDGLSVDGKLVFRYFANDHFNPKCVNPFVPISASFPYNMPSKVQDKVHNEIQRLITLLGMTNTTYNFDMRIDKDYNVYLMEIAPRDGGNYIPQIIKYATGVDLVEYSVRCAMGEKIDCDSFGAPSGYYAYYAVHSLKDGILDRVKINEDVIKNNIVENHILVKEGDEIHAFTGANTTLGILLMRFDSMEQMLHMMDNSHEWIEVILK